MSKNNKIQRPLNLFPVQEWSDTVIGQSFYFNNIEGKPIDKSKNYDGI